MGIISDSVPRAVEGAFDILGDYVKYRMTRPPKETTPLKASEYTPQPSPLKGEVSNPPLPKGEGGIVERHNLDQQTLAYQEQLLYSELWLAEQHAKQDFHGCSTDLHCGFKHGLDLTALAVETKSMTSDPMWQKIEDMGNEMMQKAHPSRVGEGHYGTPPPPFTGGPEKWVSNHHDEYQVLAIRIGELRKEMGNRVMARRKPAAAATEVKEKPSQPGNSITLEDAQKMAAEQAAAEVKRQWHLAEKKSNK
jgi:hypothetical protein